ncbi:MAG: TldD/PmbA family protein [Clostridiales bacterium]|nr:TldD/PmbA family protein [Clostridiales bacterium]
MLQLNRFAKHFSNYTELRMQENKNMSIRFLNSNLVENEKKSTSGVSSRVFNSGSWGFASNPEINDVSIIETIKLANENAQFLSRKCKKSNKIYEGPAFTHSLDLGTDKNRISQKGMMNFVKEIDNYIEKKFTDLITRTVLLNFLGMDKTILTSVGSAKHSLWPRTMIIVKLGVDKNGEPISAYELFGGRGHFEDLFSKPSDLFEDIDKLYTHLKNKSEGVYAEAGEKEVILDADLAGILAHEAIGHTTEADIVLGGSIAADYIDKKVSSSLITLTDYAHSYNGVLCPTPIYVDDEGTKAEDVVIIEDGILKEFMHNKETAATFDTIAKGNARAYQYFDEPLVRMRNTAIQPGKSKLKDMIASIEDGYYFMRSGNGQADSTSEFMFAVTVGYEIKNGKLARGIRDTTIAGLAFDVLKSATMVSDDMVWGCGGMCGKKQIIPVGMGGPAIKCRINVGGK